MCSMWLFVCACLVRVCVSLDSAQHEQQLQSPNHSLSCAALSSGGRIDSILFVYIIYGSIGPSWQPFSIYFLLNNEIGFFVRQNTPGFHTCPDLNDNTLIHLYLILPSSHTPKHRLLSAHNADATDEWCTRKQKLTLQDRQSVHCRKANPPQSIHKCVATGTHTQIPTQCTYKHTHTHTLYIYKYIII